MTWVRFPSPAPLLPLLTLVAGLLAGCEAQEREPRGIVSLAPAITETILQLGEGERLVAVSDYGPVPAAGTVPRVGTAITPDFEAIARLRPARILIDHSGRGHARDLARLAPVTELPWLTLEDVLAGIRRIGPLLEAGPAAEALARRVGRTLAVPAPVDGPRVLLALDGAELARTWYIRSNSLHGRVLHAAGARNALPAPVEGAAVLSPEGLLAAAPDAIVVLAAEGDPAVVAARAQARFAPLRALPAVVAGRIGAVVGDAYLQPGPGVVDLVAPLRAELDRLWP